jgi:hypothetical protein
MGRTKLSHEQRVNQRVALLSVAVCIAKHEGIDAVSVSRLCEETPVCEADIRVCFANNLRLRTEVARMLINS